VFCRYSYFDYEDELANYNSGTVHMVLAGMSFVR
jgi:hypothetical protein